MQIQDPALRISFFDDESLENFRFWKKDAPLKKPSDVKIIEGILFKRSSSTGFWKSRYFVLFEDRLAYHKNGRDGAEVAHCLIQNMRLETISNEDVKDEKYGIRLTHNSCYSDLYARSKEQHEMWISALSNFCVLNQYGLNFVNVKVIGKGSFAKVYLVKRKQDGVNLAVKTFDKSLLLKQDKAKASLISEINIMRRLDHDSIIKLHDVYESENHVYLVLEVLHGGELFDRIVKKGQYTERDACTLMTKLLSALTYMHSRGIMHRDIKPENLILKDVENDWNVKIADFGLATFVNPNHDYLFKRCGTPGYVAPEVLADQKYDQKVDVFSCGVILYILLTGGSPFYGKSYNEILWKNKVCEISFDFKELGHKVSGRAIDLMRKMLAKDPTARITAHQALNHDWITTGGINASPSGTGPYYLSSAQENMKRFQEENRFNVKSIKPKDLNRNGDLERSGHAPSPLINPFPPVGLKMWDAFFEKSGRAINGRLFCLSARSSNSMGILVSVMKKIKKGFGVNGNLRTIASNSPDLRRTSMMSAKSKFGDGGSMSGYYNSSGVSSIDETDDVDADSDEQSMIMQNMSKYRNGFTLISQIKDTTSSNNSSRQGTPLIGAKYQDPAEQAKKAMNVQESLLGYLKTGQSYVESIIDPEQQKKTDSVKNSLRQFQ